MKRSPIRMAALRLKSRASLYEVDLRRLATQSTKVDFSNVAREFIRRAGFIASINPIYLWVKIRSKTAYFFPRASWISVGSIRKAASGAASLAP